MNEDAVTAWLRLLRERVVSTLRLEDVRARAWSSVTFSGARITTRFSLEGDNAHAEADSLTAAMATGLWSMRGHILADAAVVADVRKPGLALLTVEAVTVDDDA